MGIVITTKNKKSRNTRRQTLRLITINPQSLYSSGKYEVEKTPARTAGHCRTDTHTHNNTLQVTQRHPTTRGKASKQRKACKVRAHTQPGVGFTLKFGRREATVLPIEQGSGRGMDTLAKSAPPQQRGLYLFKLKILPQVRGTR